MHNLTLRKYSFKVNDLVTTPLPAGTRIIGAVNNEREGLPYFVAAVNLSCSETINRTFRWAKLGETVDLDVEETLGVATPADGSQPLVLVEKH